MRSRAGAFVPSVILFGIIMGGLCLRLWGSGFGLPEYTLYHPDEHALVERASAILWTGDWNLHRFNYPPFYAYIQAAGYAAHFLWGAAQGQWNQVVPFTLPQQYLVGRWITAFFGTLTIGVVYLAGRRLWSQTTGLLAAALLGGSYLHIIHSHYATFDVMVAFLATLTLLFSELLRAEHSSRWYFLAGLSAGLAGATKYNGAVVVVVPFVAHALSTRWTDWSWLSGRLWLGAGGFLLGFFGGNPFALANLPDFLNGLATVLHHYGTEQPGFEGPGGWRWYLRASLASADSAWFVTGVTGLFALLWKDLHRGALLVAFPVVYCVVASRFVVHFERNMVPLLPFLALSGAWLIEQLSHWLIGRLHKRPGLLPQNLVTTSLAMVVLLAPLTAATLFDNAIRQTDLREIAGQWIEQNIEWGSRIAIEHYSVPFDHLDYQVEDVMRITDHDLNWYREQNFDILVISDGVWDLLRQKPAMYRQKVDTYNALTGGTTLLAEFVPKPPKLVVAGYPTVGVYHFAPVRIYQVSH